MYHARILSAWHRDMDHLNGRPLMARLRAGDITVGHYQSILVETYHNARINPQQQAFATLFMKGASHEVVKKFYQHAISEIGHDLLALNDLKAMRVDEQKVVQSRPLPSTVAFTAFPVFRVQLHGPLGYLGYLYHLERLPTGDGPAYVKMLERLGVPAAAVTFLEEHATVDVAHNKLMDLYITELVTNDRDCDDLIYQVRCAAKLHTLMLEGAIERVDDDPRWLDRL